MTGFARRLAPAGRAFAFAVLLAAFGLLAFSAGILTDRRLLDRPAPAAAATSASAMSSTAKDSHALPATSYQGSDSETSRPHPEAAAIHSPAPSLRRSIPTQRIAGRRASPPWAAHGDRRIHRGGVRSPGTATVWLAIGRQPQFDA